MPVDVYDDNAGVPDSDASCGDHVVEPLYSVTTSHPLSVLKLVNVSVMADDDTSTIAHAALLAYVPLDTSATLLYPSARYTYVGAAPPQLLLTMYVLDRIDAVKPAS